MEGRIRGSLWARKLIRAEGEITGGGGNVRRGQGWVRRVGKGDQGVTLGEN